MKQFVEIEFEEIEENNSYEELIQTVVKTCFEEEKLTNTQLYLNVILTTPEKIRKANKQYRNIDKETDVLSFPMFQQEEIQDIIESSLKEDSIMIPEVLGDIIVSIDRVKEQAQEYGHGVERELAYMIVHGFYHIMGYDHIKEEEKAVMRPKEEEILTRLKITR